MQGGQLLKFQFQCEVNLLSFLKAVDGCEGKIVFVSGKGDRLDLKSQLCKVLLLTMKPEEPASLDCRVECSREDGEKLSEFLVIPE